MIIPYDQKVDQHLDSLQTFVECFDELEIDIREKHNDIHREQIEGVTIYLDDVEFKRRVKDQIDMLRCRQLALMQTQAAVNKAMLELLEAMMQDAYPRAKRRR